MKVQIPSTREPAFTAGVIVTLDPDDEAYWRYWSDVWAAGDSVINIEHDVVPSGAAIAELVECPNQWCTQPYPYFVGDYHGLGCVKFTGDLMRATPQLWDMVAQISNPQHPFKHWCSLDAWSQQALARLGYTMCRHQTRVDHHYSGKPSHGCA